MNKTFTVAAAALLVLAGAAYVLFYSPTEAPETQRLRVLCAGSLVYPLAEVEGAFEEEYPWIDVEAEGHGSIQVIRHPVELGDRADLLLVADYSLIPLMMYDAPLPDGSGNYTDWYIRFAGNEVVLAYTEKSRYAEELTMDNWYEILAREDVKLGISNPIIDALGYRGLQLLVLAEYHYGEPYIFESVLGDWFSPAFESVEVGEKTVVFVPEEERPLGGKIAMRASSIQLSPLLDSGGVDYAFLYLSNAEQYGYGYLRLPREVNMGDPSLDGFYAKAQVKFQHQRFQSIGTDRYGKTIYYGLTIPADAENQEEAELFAEYILGGEGKAIFESLSHPVFEPSMTDNMDGVPERLRRYLVEELQ
jgi:molybdate/tungstate transport system substrate-binding protein